MLFNSYLFIFIFLPISLIGYYKLSHLEGGRISKMWLVFMSLFFYGWWNPIYVLLIAGSIIFNFFLGHALSRDKVFLSAKITLGVGIFSNLLLLGYFKYTNFFLSNINNVFEIELPLQNIVLPLAISFFTFQQIAYLVDSYQDKTSEHNFVNYCLFVTFFPQLISGPIVHHKEMMPQFSEKNKISFRVDHFAIGISIFIIGLFKKTVIADQMATYATPIFTAALDGHMLTFFEAWAGVLAYTFQIYFDFSGYTDMAIGLARMFGISLPINFYSPYRAVNIIEFWRRWHITLSRFLKDYLYIPLGGNRKGSFWRIINISIVMLLGGLWHGASWTFVIWGGLHGVYFIVNHAWRALVKAVGFNQKDSSFFLRITSRALTFFSVVIAWVFFRTENLSSATSILKAMMGQNGFQLWESYKGVLNKFAGLGDVLADMGWQFSDMVYFYGKSEIVLIFLLFIVIWMMPNTHQITAHFKPALEIYGGKIDKAKYLPIKWQPNFWWASIMVVLSLTSLSGFMTKAQPFLYFQF